MTIPAEGEKKLFNKKDFDVKLMKSLAGLFLDMRDRA